MKFVLIGNYYPDHQESMLRFAKMLQRQLEDSGYQAKVWQPLVLFGPRNGTSNRGVGKWLGYIDKWIIFPAVLRWRLLFRFQGVDHNTHYHICDHSNAPYLAHLPKNRTAITCHDVIAIRGARGDSTAHSSPSRFAPILQGWIFNHLRTAVYLVAVSNKTLNDLKALTGLKPTENQKWIVAHNAFNAEFRPCAHTESRLRLSQFPELFDAPFLLHVGSGHPRKNRTFILKILYAWQILILLGWLLHDSRPVPV